MGRESLCDIARSEALTPSELRSLQTLHEGLAREFGTALSAMLRNPVEAGLAGIDQLAYGEFVHGLESPSYFNVVKAEPLGDCLMLDIELAILYPLLDRMLGGGHADEPSPRRPPTDIELPLTARIVRLFLENLRGAWKSVLPLQFEVLQVESHPQRLRVVPSDELVALVGFALTVGDRQGMMRLCLPCRAIRRIADKLANARCQPATASGNAEIKDADDCGPCSDLVVTLATTSIAASELRGLRVGDIIATETSIDSPAVVSLDGEPKFHAKPGTYQGRKAVVLSDANPDLPS